MLFPDPEREKLFAAIIALGAQNDAAAEMQTVLTAGKRAKPPGFDDTVGGMAQRYRGDQEALVRAKIAERYPDAGKMPVSPINWLAFFARSDAGVYVVDADADDAARRAGEGDAESEGVACRRRARRGLRPRR